MTTTSTHEAVLADVLTRWKTGVDAHQPADVAALFTNDAIFQGLHPYGVGPAAVAEYYASQPLGMVADYEILETRTPADGLVLGYMLVTFSFTDREPLAVNLSLVVTQVGDEWKISHYQVSKLG
jgi:hypothetical protein